MRLDHPCGDRAGLIDADGHLTRFIVVDADDEALDVQNDIGDIFHDAGDRTELVRSAFDLDVRDRSAFERRQ